VDAQLEATLSRGWRLEGQALVRELRFKDFDEALEFSNELGRCAADHFKRPDLAITSNRLRLTVANTHNAGITLAELRLAAKVDAVIDSR
jgi:pterin-4a-carbinolamine dehydratase